MVFIEPDAGPRMLLPGKCEGAGAFFPRGMSPIAVNLISLTWPDSDFSSSRILIPNWSDTDLSILSITIIL